MIGICVIIGVAGAVAVGTEGTALTDIFAFPFHFVLLYLQLCLAIQPIL